MDDEQTFYERLGARLARFRADREMSQCELARRSGVHQVSVCRYETAKKRPNLDTLRRLARAFGVTLADIVRGL